MDMKKALALITDTSNGKIYEVWAWYPGRAITNYREVIRHFTDGFKANSSAFSAWLARCGDGGFYASVESVPEIASYFYGSVCKGDSRCARYGRFDPYHADHYVFVAFREAKGASGQSVK